MGQSGITANPPSSTAHASPLNTLTLDQRLPENILPRQKKIESQGHGFFIGCATVQSVEIRNALTIENTSASIISGARSLAASSTMRG